VTTAELIAEITTGPLAADLAAAWAATFEAEPEPPAAARPAAPEDPADPGSVAAWKAYQTRARWERIRHRFGTLKPDAVADILRVLSDPSRRGRPTTTVSRGAFVAALAPLAFALVGLDEPARQKWSLILTLATGGDDEVNLTRPELQLLLDLAGREGLLSAGQRDGLRAGPRAPCSRLAELGWAATPDDIQAAKAAEAG